MASSVEAMHVPRTRLRDRDIEALAFIGRGYEVAQYQLHEAVFASRSPNVVSRFVTRASERGFIAAERLGGIGMNRLRLTRRGCGFLIDRGIAEDELFAPAKAVALKDVAHTTAINDLVVALLGRPNPPSFVSAAWCLQRRLTASTAIPDVLASWPPGRTRGMLLGCEIDLGAEPLASVFLPKLRRLARLLDEARDTKHAAIAVFTRGAKRIALLSDSTNDSGVKLMAIPLPETCGSREGIRAFQALLAE
jgi:hypothetical protein